MNIIYTGKHQLTPAQQGKLGVKLARLSRLLDRREGEKEAHVILTSERHLHRAEITLNFYDHQVAGAGSDADQFGAIASAIDKLEKQILKQREKWRDTKRVAGALVPEEEAENEEGAARQVFRVNHSAGRKPMTLEEALLEMEQDHDYLVYRDTETDRISVLVRRRDGNFDLIEA